MKYGVLVLVLLVSLRVVQAQSCVDYHLSDSYPSYPITVAGQQYNWNSAAWNFPTLEMNKVTGLNIGGTFLFKGMLEYLPSDYNPANTSTKHPLLIYFHGGGSAGEGNDLQLCRLFKDRGSDLATHLSIPGRVERTPELFTQTVSSQTFKFIVVAPQFTVYRRTYPDPGNNLYPSGDEVEDVIDFLVARYPNKIDLDRIYLTGFSNGANMIMEYVGSSLARAQRVAAVMPISLCSDITHFSNSHLDASHIGNAQLPVWFVNCQTDNPCLPSVPTQWYNDIKNTPGRVLPRFTMLRDALPNPLYQCSDSLTHDAWSRAYNPDFTASFVDGTGANDGINQNMYQWLLSQTNSVLPVALKSYTARLSGGRVDINWVTSSEKDNASFTIERAGEDQNYVAIATITGAGNSATDKQYAYTDNSPLAGLNFYRLVQTDIDGEKTYFDIKKIFNQGGTASSVTISPNPFGAELSAYVNVDRTQKVLLSLTDMTGKVLQNVNSIYASGSTEVKFRSAGLPSGIYLLKASGENFSITRKVMKK